MKQLFNLILTLFFSFQLCAQVPQAFNYQGVARNFSGTPIANQNIGLRITILQGSANGTEVYKEIHLTTTNNLGLFNIPVGKGTPAIGVFSEIDWSNGDHFIQIEMDENGGSDYQLIGTSQLLSVPYALQAGSQYWSIDEHKRIYYESAEGENRQVGFRAHSIDPETGELKTSFISLAEFKSSWPTDGLTPTRETLSGPMLLFVQNKDGETFPSDRAVIVRSTDALQFRVEEVQDPQIPGTNMVITEEGNVGIDTETPKAKLQVANGDIYVENAFRGVIMKSPSGQCWRLTVDNVGRVDIKEVPCPEE